MKVETLICKSLDINLILCPFNSITTVGPSLVPMICLAIGSEPNNGATYKSHFVEQGLSPIRKFLVAPMKLMPVLHH